MPEMFQAIYRVGLRRELYTWYRVMIYYKYTYGFKFAGLPEFMDLYVIKDIV